MNVMHLVDEPYDSGIVHYALTLAAGLRERGHAVAVGGLPEKPPLRIAASLGLDTVAVASFPSGAIALRRALRERRVDVLNAHTGSSQTLAVTATRAMSGAPIVIRTRGDRRAPKRNPGAMMLWKRTAGFIAATQTILDEFKACFPELAIPCRAVPPGVEDIPDAPFPEPKTPPFRVGIVGRLDPVKGHIHFLRAAAKVLKERNDVVFVVAGREENVKIKQLARVAEGLGISRDVEFLGYVPHAADIMRECHVGVISSIGSEAVSRAAIEWMRCGRALVSTTVGGLPELLSRGETGILVPPQDSDAMAEAILRLLENEEFRREQARRTRRRYETAFTLAKMTDETEKAYEDCLRGISSR